MALTEKLSAIGDAIRAKTGGTALLTLDQMPTEIAAIETGGGGDLPEEAFVITGECQYRFSGNGWNWFIDQYGNKITSSEISNMSSMFCNSTTLESIPFEINDWELETNMESMFSNCRALKEIPKIKCTPSNTGYLFAYCNSLREIPNDWTSDWDWSFIDNSENEWINNGNKFQECVSLRSFPMDLFSHGQPSVYKGYSVYHYAFYYCCALDEIVDLPNPHYNTEWTENAFDFAFANCQRLKNLTFKMPDGAPYVVKWSNQFIDLSELVGRTDNRDNIINTNSGITADKQVKDAATYAALKDDPDWWTTHVGYSRYNHDSAVATINSLPDASAYVAEMGGINTIQFLGASGWQTTGGGIRTLTEEEIAVAAAKGWTVTLV